MRSSSATGSYFAVALLFAAALPAALFQTAPQPDGSSLPGFQERAGAHVARLAALGDRVSGGRGEAAAAAYIQQQMERAGLRVTAEPFEFDSFQLESAVLAAGREKAEIVRLGFNPYTGGERRGGELAFVESTANMREVIQLKLDDKIVVTTESGNFFALSIFQKPRAIAAVAKADFMRLRPAGVAPGEISFRGKTVTLRSRNIVGALASRARGAREIILSAHYDSWKGPGANDNASGVAALLELARRFASQGSQPAASIRFVAFGGEEFGLMGAKAYVEKHRNELANCMLMFNIDTVGGSGAVITETRPADPGMPAQDKRFPNELVDKAANDIEARWMLLGAGMSPMLAPPTAPEWLRAAISEKGKAMGLEMRASNGMGSDHRVFAQAGVPATNIGVSGEGTHTAQDVPQAVNTASIEKAAQLVAEAVDRAIRAGE